MKNPPWSSASRTQDGAPSRPSDPALESHSTGPQSVVSLADASPGLSPRGSLIAVARSRGRGAFYRLWMLLRVEPKLIVIGALFQGLQAVSHIPFTAGLGYFIDRILPARRLDFIGYYALANLLLLPVHGAFALAAYVCAQRLVRATVIKILAEPIQLLLLRQ